MPHHPILSSLFDLSSHRGKHMLPCPPTVCVLAVAIPDILSVCPFPKLDIFRPQSLPTCLLSFIPSRSHDSLTFQTFSSFFPEPLER